MNELRTCAGAVSAMALLAAIGAASPASAAPACGEACLTGMMHRVLDSMARHSAAGVPLAADADVQQNAKPVPVGEGVWKTVDRVDPGLLFADPVLGGVVYAGAAEVKGQPEALFVRLKVTGGKITEVEIFSRDGEPGAMAAPAELRTPDLIYDTVAPPARRSSRAELARIATSYMVGIGRHDPRDVPFSVRCDRYAAGYKFTNNPAQPVERGGGTCATSFDNLKGQDTVNRRITVIDPAKGIVSIEFLIPHGEAKPQRTTNVGEIFKIVDGKIRSIEEFGTTGGFPPSSGFPDR